MNFDSTWETRIQKASEKLAKATQEYQANRGRQTPKTEGLSYEDYLKRLVERAESELDEVKRGFLVTLFPRASNREDQAVVFANARGTLCTFYRNGKPVAGRLIAVTPYSVEILTDDSNKVVLKIADLQVEQTVVDSAKGDPHKLDEDLRALKERQDLEEKRRTTAAEALRESRAKAAALKQPQLVQESYRPGGFAVIVAPSIPFREAIEGWANEVIAAFPGKTSSQFIAAKDLTTMTLNLRALPPEARAYVDNAIHFIAQGDLSNARVQIEEGKAAIAVAAERERTNLDPWPSFLHSEDYLAMGTSYDHVPKGNSTVHTNVSMNRFATYHGVRDGIPYRARVIHIMNEHGAIYGKEAIVIYTGKDGVEYTKFYSIGTHVNDPRESVRAPNSCLGCHSALGGGLTVPGNAFHGVQSRQLQTLDEVNPWIRQ